MASKTKARYTKRSQAMNPKARAPKKLVSTLDSIFKTLGVSGGKKSAPSKRKGRTMRRNDPTKEGPRVVSKEAKYGARLYSQDRSSGVASNLINYGLSSQTETIEDIRCTVNPYILSQYVAGVVFKACASSDRPQDYAIALSMIKYYCKNLSNIGAITSETTWPRAIVELGWALTDRRVGKFNYTVHWDPVAAWQADVATNGFTVTNSGWASINLSAGGTVTSGGYITTSTLGVADPTFIQVDAFQTNFFSGLDLVPIERGANLDKHNDASAFAFDPTGGREYSSAGTYTLNLVFMVGYDGTDILYLPNNSSANLETKIGRPHLAAIRLCTAVPGYGNPRYHTEIVNTIRSGKYSQQVYAPPSLLGYQRVTPSLRGKTQLKLVPGNGALNAILARLESVVSKIPGTPVAGKDWVGSFSVGDVQNLAIYMYRTFLRQFSGAAIGVYSKTPNGNVVAAENLHALAANSSIRAMRVPEFIQKLMGAQTVFSDSDGTLIPFVTVLSAPTPSLTYTGTGIYSSPVLTTGIGWAVNVSSIVAIYKQFEAYIAPFENLQNSGEYGPTMLDFSFTRDFNASFVCGLASRRRITTESESNAFLLSPMISYTVTSATAGSADLQSTAIDHTFRQHNRKAYSGYDSTANVFAASKFDGIVVGALTSNISNATGPDMAPNSRDSPSGPLSRPRSGVLLKELPPSQLSFVTKWAQRMLPRAGKYCGPGWTAGVDTADEASYVNSKGEYIIPPSSDEDAICKRHDEAYLAANGDKKLVSAADRDMVHSLQRLRLEKGLTLYGAAAELAIAAKAGLADLSDAGAKEYRDMY